MPPSEIKLAALKGLILDCDGVLTPGDFFYDEQGARLLRFNTRDSFALAALAHTDVAIAVLTGRPSDIVAARCRELGVRLVEGNCPDKAKGVVQLCERLKVSPQACAFIGDDLPDLGAFSQVGVKIAVADATPEILAAADWVTKAPGGRGAVREVCEALLKARGDWPKVLARCMGEPLPVAPGPA